MKSPNANPAAYSTMRSNHIGNPSVAVMTAARMMPVASPATQWIVEPTPLFPEWCDERFVLTWARLFVRHHVEQETERSHVQRDEDKPPFHHDGLGVVPILIPRHVDRRSRGEREPRNEKIIDRSD